MKLTSICGLGQFAHAPITSVLKHFREEIEAHIVAASLSGRRVPDATRSSVSDVQLTIDGLAVTVPAGTTVFDAARMNGIAIPDAVPSAERNAGRACAGYAWWKPAAAC